MESLLHKKLKEKIAEGFRELGYESGIEAYNGTGKQRADVVGKKGKESLWVEIDNTHVPDWVMVKVRGNGKERGSGKPLKKYITFSLDSRVAQALDEHRGEINRSKYMSIILAGSFGIDRGPNH